MIAIAITTLLWVITLFGCLAAAKLEFFPQALPEWCSVEGIERQCGRLRYVLSLCCFCATLIEEISATDGMCAFENDVTLLWCCRPLDP